MVAPNSGLMTSLVAPGKPSDQLPGTDHEPPAALVQMSFCAEAAAVIAKKPAQKAGTMREERMFIGANGLWPSGRAG